MTPAARIVAMAAALGSLSVASAGSFESPCTREFSEVSAVDFIAETATIDHVCVKGTSRQISSQDSVYLSAVEHTAAFFDALVEHASTCHRCEYPWDPFHGMELIHAVLDARLAAGMVRPAGVSRYEPDETHDLGSGTAVMTWHAADATAVSAVVDLSFVGQTGKVEHLYVFRLKPRE